MKTMEAVARTICSACGEQPDSAGEEPGHKERWQDYEEVAEAVMEVMADGGVLVRLGKPAGYKYMLPELVVAEAIGDRWPVEEIFFSLTP